MIGIISCRFAVRRWPFSGSAIELQACGEVHYWAPVSLVEYRPLVLKSIRTLCRAFFSRDALTDGD